MEFLKWYSLIPLLIIEMVLIGTIIFTPKDWIKSVVAFVLYAPVLVYILTNIL